MYKKIFQTFALAFTTIFSPVILANSCYCPEGLKPIVESLKLDDSQKAKIKPVLEQLASTVKNDSNQMEALFQQEKQKLESTNIDQAAVNSLIDQQAKLNGEIIKAKVNARIQISAVLSPQQQTDFQNKIKKNEEKIVKQFKNCHED
ncbi:periplasmic repressor CpxP [Legionella massiliensis]|uniref:Periplasmic repressor CpxP n=1 Tax=Legionella massiliensis TaxID=1034943 RepID=A0A078L577_9GAMM|nr:Spy/CpxP family protein refolding chaperone [Legionella massiliensis]CDZ79068.1 periplasmic repressor CpxP [Legionella massiliensis]CEE14806.1 periplasmic repressor CpxP [Legionella massiliensis]